MRSTHAVFSILAAFLVTACDPASESESPAEDGAARTYVELLGTDTMAIERFSADAERLEGTLVVRAPVTEVHTYEADLDGQGGVTRLAGTVSVPEANAGARPDRSYEYVARGDSADILAISGSDTTRATVELPAGALPIPPRVPAPPSFMELATARLAAGAADAPLSFVDAASGRSIPSGLVARGADTVAIIYFGSPLLITRSADGTIQQISGRESTMRTETGPAAGSLDVESLAGDYAARDAAGTGIGVPSPADMARASVAGSDLEVAYSQPAMRGRAIWGGLVPFGETWRTGANAATAFRTTADIRVGDTAVPAGEYTLWTLFTEDGAELIINSQTGQWGTAYDEAQDFARVPMEMVAAPEAYERFTIGVDGDAAGGRLTLSWDDRTYFVPIAPA